MNYSCSTLKCLDPEMIAMWNNLRLRYWLAWPYIYRNIRYACLLSSFRCTELAGDGNELLEPGVHCKGSSTGSLRCTIHSLSNMCIILDTTWYIVSNSTYKREHDWLSSHDKKITKFVKLEYIYHNQYDMQHPPPVEQGMFNTNKINNWQLH